MFVPTIFYYPDVYKYIINLAFLQSGISESVIILAKMQFALLDFFPHKAIHNIPRHNQFPIHSPRFLIFL